VQGNHNLPAPYYDHAGITIYHGDCREILPLLPKVDLVLTDPPYPSYYTQEYRYSSDLILALEFIQCRQFIFWTPSVAFPLPYSGKRIWDKAVGTCTQFEEIYERNSASGYKIHRAYSMGCFSSVGAEMTGDIITGHPSQKPLRLIAALVNESDADLILDPFMGSGTTLVAAKQLGRRAIGIEIELKYCQIAVERLSQEMLPFAEPTPEPVQDALFGDAA
jgi:DNA modification methylase